MSAGAAPPGGAGDPAAPGTRAAGGEAVRIEGLRKSFGPTVVLQGIDLTLQSHQVICLIGASGSGKSTLLRCVNLLEPIDAGRIRLWGQDITAAAGSTRTWSAGTWASCSSPTTCSRT